MVCETSAKFLLISYSSSFGIQIKDVYSVFGDPFWPRQVGRTATKLSCVTQKSLHCPLHFIASRRHFECYFLRARTTYHQESAGKIPTEWGMGSSFTFSQASLVSFQEKKNDLLLNELKFEKTDNVFIKSIHSGLWQNFLSLLAQMVVEQEADKLFS